MTGYLARSFQYFADGSVGDSGRNLLAVEANRWRKLGDITDIPKYENGRTNICINCLILGLKGDYLKCNNISFGL